ncbi:MAG: N-acetyltransferase [Clostridiales bacterium]|nr:N-acetyltransferase [Clostridiales bacterium]
MNVVVESNRIYYEDAQGKLLAEVTFPDISYHVVNINHTFVDDSLRGQGIASKLLKEAAEQIQKSGKKAIPTCSYAVKWFEKNPQYADILETKSQNQP